MRGLAFRQWALRAALGGSLLFAQQASVAFAATATLFKPFNAPIGVAATGDRIYVTTYCDPGTPRPVTFFDPTGTPHTLNTVPGVGGCIEEYVAVSPGGHGFNPDDVFVVRLNQVYRLTPDGTSSTPFATLPTSMSANSGIGFDHTGNFNFDLFVATGNDGHLYKVDSAGVVTTVASLGTDLEGTDVAPASFTPFAGWVMVASESAGGVFAVPPTCGVGGKICGSGDVTFLSALGDAESVHFVPPTVCDFSNTTGAFFTAHYPSEIDQYHASDFATVSAGTLLVVDEFGGIRTVTSNGTTHPTYGIFDTDGAQHEGSAFVDCSVPPIDNGSGGVITPPSTGATPELDSLILFGSGAAGLAGYALTRWRARSPHSED